MLSGIPEMTLDQLGHSRSAGGNEVSTLVLWSQSNVQKGVGTDIVLCSHDNPCEHKERECGWYDVPVVLLAVALKFWYTRIKLSVTGSWPYVSTLITQSDNCASKSRVTHWLHSVTVDMPKLLQSLNPLVCFDAIVFHPAKWGGFHFVILYDPECCG